MKTDAPIFIVGAPRSGTTLTAKILGRHSNIFMPGETHFFQDIYSMRGELGDPPEEQAAKTIYARLSDLYDRYYEPDDQKRVNKLLGDPAHRERLLMACRAGYRQALDCFMEMQMRHEGKLRWGNNAPRDLFHVEEILNFYPHACFIACVRDPRDFLLSYKGKWKVTGKEHAERLRRLYHPVVTTLLWKASMRRVLRLQDIVPPWQWLVMPYESLVSEPEKSVRAMCSLAGEDFQSGMLETDYQNSSEETRAKGIFTSSIGRWREKLDPAEVAVAQHLAASQMRLLGYARESVHPNIFRVASTYLSAPFKLFLALKANAAMTGPLLPYLVKRVRSLVG